MAAWPGPDRAAKPMGNGTIFVVQHRSMLRTIDRVILRVPSLAAAVVYYRDTLGLKLLRQDPRLASFQLGDGVTELVLHTEDDLPAEGIYYRVEDVRDLYRRREELRLHFVSAPAPAARGYRATVKDPFGTVLLLIDRTIEAGGGGEIEDGKTPGALFAGVETRTPVKAELLIALYLKVGRTADDLPYTPHFESLHRGYAAGHPAPGPERQETWRHLLNLRKGGKLPKLGEARSKPPEVTAEAKELLRWLVGEDLGRRDRLPYTARFDQIVDAFNKSQNRPLSPHLVWRLVATLAK